MTTISKYQKDNVKYFVTVSGQKSDFISFHTHENSPLGCSFQGVKIRKKDLINFVKTLEACE